jgi:hypothetical protein
LKQCSACLEKFTATSENFYKNKNNSDGLHSYCKECAKSKSLKYRNENIERAREISRNYYLKDKEKHRKVVKAWDHKNKEKKKAYLKDWQQNNKDKISEYRIARSNKKHDISLNEWENCKAYFNNECAYCGISETEAKVKYNNVLHKEHVDHEGANDLSNCIPACKSCNSSKHENNFEEWYSEKNTNFTYDRLEKIVKWLSDDFYKYID